MQPENSRHYYLPPSVEAPERADLHAAPVMTARARRASRREWMLHQVTYILVSLAALVYVCEHLFGGMGTMFHSAGGVNLPGVRVEGPPAATSAAAPGAPAPPIVGRPAVGFQKP